MRSNAAFSLALFLMTGCAAMDSAPAPTLAAASPARTARLADGFKGIWYEIRDAQANVVKYGGGLATYPQQVAPMAIHVPSQHKTFFAVMLDEGDGLLVHALSYFDHRTGEVARPRVWVEKKTGDAHDAPAIAFDRKGRLILFSMTHGEERESFIHRSVEPYSIDRFESLLDPTDGDDFAAFGSTDKGVRVLRFSYGQPWALRDGRLLLLHTRYSQENPQAGGERDLYWTLSDDGDRWSVPTPLAKVERGQYATSWPKPDGTLGVIFDYHPDGVTGAPLDSRTDLFYLETRDGRSWRNVQGAMLVGPGQWIASPDNPARVYDAPEGERVYIKAVAYQPDGSPVLLFLTSPTNLPSAAPRLLKTAQWTKGQWIIRDALTTDHNYDHGTFNVAGGVWTIVGPYLPGPQAQATGGLIAEWRSTDEGKTWTMVRRFTHSGDRNDTYVRQPLNADPAFWSFWADGNGITKSEVDIYFADRAGNRFRMPRAFPPGAMTARPEPVR